MSQPSRAHSPAKFAVITVAPNGCEPLAAPDMNFGFSEYALAEFRKTNRHQENLMPASPPSRPSAPINNILAALPRADMRRIEGALDPVALTFGNILYEQDAVMKYVYFPNNSLVSLLKVVDRRLALEVGMVGFEGIVGFTFALGVATAPLRAMVQGAGTAMRMKATLFREEFQRCLPLQNQVYLYSHALISQVSQTAACNRFHVVEARLARWLLMTGDRVRSNEFRLTHEFLSDMLGVRRVGVTNAAHALKKQGLIEYNRGDIAIVNRRGLEKASCSCYTKQGVPTIN